MSFNKYLLVGNPNVGKTTIFNYFTKNNERASNISGLTFQRKEAIIPKTNNVIIDLPGIHGIGGEDKINQEMEDYILTDDYQGIIYVADINYLKKNFYLLIDILESEQKINLVLNMNDIFEGKLNIDQLKDDLGCEITVMSQKDEVDFNGLEFKRSQFKLKYPERVEILIEEIIKNKKDIESNVSDRFLAIQLLKGNNNIQSYFNNLDDLQKLISEQEKEIIETQEAHSLSGLIFKVRREYIIGLLDLSYQKKVKEISPLLLKMDKVFLHPFWGYIVFAFVMWLVFFISFQMAFLGDYIEAIMVFISTYMNDLLINLGIDGAFNDFLINGFWAGLSGILVFLPQIIILFSLLTFLETSGYLARVTILFENFFQKIGLSANSLLPLISGLGCNVLSVISTRSIKSEKKRISTILAIPFISCSARLPVYIVFIEVFFEKYQGIVLFLLYFLGIIVAIAVAYVVDKLVLKDKEELIILDLPEYKAIPMNYFFRVVIAKIKSFVFGAGKLILVGALGLWFLVHFNFQGYTQDIQSSILFNLSDIISPVLSPLGFGTAEATASFFAAFLAKELAISAMIVIYGASTPSELSTILAQSYDMASAFSFMVFTLLYIPCISTLAVMYTETRKWKIVVISVVMSLVIGYVLSFVFYNLISLFI